MNGYNILADAVDVVMNKVIFTEQAEQVENREFHIGWILNDVNQDLARSKSILATFWYYADKYPEYVVDIQAHLRRVMHSLAGYSSTEIDNGIIAALEQYYKK